MSNQHPMRTQLKYTITQFMRADEGTRHQDLEKMLLQAGVPSDNTDELIGTLGVFRDMIFGLYFEFTFTDLEAVIRRHKHVVKLLKTWLDDDLDIEL